ncbi:MAG: 3-deoxy-D-manno-octulosonic acid kinase [Proteobacteria bacterium]|nr:3-deoxy-D-manno-octulosonic acid kinase [Pseudomonadota bacterium]
MIDFHAAQGSGAIVYDPALLPQVDAGLFDPAHGGHAATPVAVGGRGSAWFVDTAAGAAVLRHYRRGGLAAKLSRDAYLWQGAQRTRSFREFRLLQGLRAAGLPAPTPLAAAYWRIAAGYRAALLVARIPGARSLGALLDRREPAPWAAIGRCIAAVHRFGVCHADLNVDNVLMDANDDCWLIDFDRGVRRRPALKWQLANIARLRRSLRKRIGARADDPEAVNGWEALLAGWNDGLRSEA